jgi:plasmid stability protein
MLAAASSREHDSSYLYVALCNQLWYNRGRSPEVKAMPILHVRNVPDTLYADLQHRAETQRRSLSAEVITLLEWALAEAERTSEMTLTSIRQRRSFNPTTAGAPDSTTLLRQDRDR